MKNTLALIKTKVGHGKVRKFVINELGQNYRTFVYQLHHGLVPYKVILVIMKKLDIKFEEFKNYEYQDTIIVHSQADKVVRAKDKKAAQYIAELHTPKPKKLSELLGTK